MSSTFRIVKWAGKEVARNIEQAAVKAVDETTRQAAEDAKASHWWGTDSGRLQALTISEPAVKRGRVISGKFGTTRRQGFYGLILEYRTPFLRPAADRVFPRLARRLVGHM